MGASAAAHSEFAVLSGDTSVTEAYGGTARFDLTRWLSLNAYRANTDRQNLIGASYINRNVEFLTNLIDRLPKPSSSVEMLKELKIVWYRPGGSTWGRYPDLQEAIISIKVAIRRKFGKVAIRTKLVCPSVSRRDQPEQFRNLFDEGCIAPLGFLSPSVEVIHVPQVATLMLVAVALSETVTIPVGFASIAAVLLSRAARKLGQVVGHFETLWRTERREEEEALPVEPAMEDMDNA